MINNPLANCLRNSKNCSKKLVGQMQQLSPPQKKKSKQNKNKKTIQTSEPTRTLILFLSCSDNCLKMCLNIVFSFLFLFFVSENMLTILWQCTEHDQFQFMVQFPLNDSFLNLVYFFQVFEVQTKNEEGRPQALHWHQACTFQDYLW